MHVLRQKDTLCQAPGDSPTFAPCPSSDTSCHEKGLITEPKYGLPAHFLPRGKHRVRTDLGSWLSVTGRLWDHNPTRHSGRWGSRGSITRDLGLLFSSTMPFSRTARRRGELGFYLGDIVVAL